MLPYEYTSAEAFAFASSDPSVAGVSSSYDSETAALVVSVTGKSAGTAAITAVSKDGLSDSFTVTVLAHFAPNLDFNMTEGEETLELRWQFVPGATEYRVSLTCNGKETPVLTTTASSCAIGKADLPYNELNELSVTAVRMVSGSDALSFAGEKLPYVALRFASSLPEHIVSADSEAFTGDVMLESLYIPDSTVNIGEGAFDACTGLVAVRVPAALGSISPDAFSGSALRFVQTAKGSPAEQWFAENMPDVIIIHE